jgi:phosphohistidine phosphatase
MLHLYLIRHAAAVPPGDPNYADDDRPLTDAGRAEARRLGVALAARGIRFDLILSSPLPRARETAEELIEGLGDPHPPLDFADELAPGAKPRKLDRHLLKFDGEAIALIGHQPDLGEYAARLIGSKKASVELAKPGVACIACEDPPGKGCGSLTMLLTPAWFGTPVKPASAIATEPPLYAGQPNGGPTG